MQDTFSVRLGKTFDSLVREDDPPSSRTSLWSLNDEVIERREWKRDKNFPEPELESQPTNNYNSTKDDLIAELENDLLDVDDDEENVEVENQDEYEDEEIAHNRNNKDYNAEEWKIRSSIGRDSTLDYEEEEDGYDNYASGTENYGDGLYTWEVFDIDPQDSMLKRKNNNELQDSSRSQKSFRSGPSDVRNPLKYTHYTFDDDDDVVEDKCNSKQGYMEFC